MEPRAGLLSRARRHDGAVATRADSDEAYVLDLCDDVLGETGLRQYRFDWLVGDPGKNGCCRELPVDGYWPGAATVVEYREVQHDRPVRHFDKPDVLTVSGVHRGAQHALYDARRDTLRNQPELLDSRIRAGTVAKLPGGQPPADR